LNFYSYDASASTGETNLPQDWVATGCWNSYAAAGKAFTGPLLSTTSMTHDICMLECQSKGYALAG
jgi:hypothetical protein